MHRVGYNNPINNRKFISVVKAEGKYGKTRSMIVNDVALPKFFEIASTMVSVVWGLCCTFVMVVAHVERSFVSLR